MGALIARIEQLTKSQANDHCRLLNCDAGGRGSASAVAACSIRDISAMPRMVQSFPLCNQCAIGHWRYRLWLQSVFELRKGEACKGSLGCSTVRWLLLLYRFTCGTDQGNLHTAQGSSLHCMLTMKISCYQGKLPVWSFLLDGIIDCSCSAKVA